MGVVAHKAITETLLRAIRSNTTGSRRRDCDGEIERAGGDFISSSRSRDWPAMVFSLLVASRHPADIYLARLAAGGGEVGAVAEVEVP